MIIVPKRSLVHPRRFPGRQRGFIINPYNFAAAGGGGGFSIRAADMDGATFIKRTASMTGQADVTSATLVFWINRDSLDGKNILAGQGADGSQALGAATATGGGKVTVRYGASSGFASRCNQQALSDLPPGWTCVLSSCRVVAGSLASHLYYGDINVLDGGSSSLSAGTLGYAGVTNWYVGAANNSATFAMDGGLAEVWFMSGVYTDFSVQANRRLFIDANGLPVDLGATGSNPTGSAPLFFCHLDSSDAATAFATNRAGKGDFTTTTGTVGLRATSPSDGPVGTPSAAIDGAAFDGTNDLLSRASFTGQTSSKTGILSFWVRSGNWGSQPYIILGQRMSDFTLAIEAFFDFNGKLNIDASDANTGGALFTMQSTFNLPATNLWHHVLASWDMAGAAGAQHLYINDQNVKSLTFGPTNRNVIYGAVTEWSGGAYSPSDGNGSKLIGDLAELYFAPGQYLDFSVASNRRKFITLSGRPVNLGATGNTPTGSVPLVFNHLADAEAAANFATNRAGNGNWTVTGALGTATTSPSD